MEKPAFGPNNSRKQGKTSARTTMFILSDCNTYGLHVTASHSSGSSPVASVDYRFCLVFGREKTVDPKRRLIKTTKQFGAPFRKENYKIHLNAAHPTKARALALLTSREPLEYEARIPTPAQFNIVVKLVAIGIRLKQTTKAVVAAKEETLFQLLGFACELKTQQYVSIVCAVNLQLLTDILRKVWAFSFALNGSTCLGTSYIDMRVRFVRQGCIYNLHALAAARAQRNILLQRVYEESDDFEYWKVLVDVVGHFRHQQLLVGKMRATCPLVPKVRWLSMYDVTSFLSDRRAEVRIHYESPSSTQTSQHTPPTTRWWLQNHVVCVVIGEIKIVITQLQGKMTLLSQQEAQIEELRGALIPMVQMELVNHETSVNTRNWVQRGRLCLRKTSIAEFVQNSHVFYMDQYDDILSLAVQEQVVDVIGTMVLHLIEGLGNIVVIYDRTSEASDDSVPPVLPHKLVVLPSCEILKMSIKQKDRLMSSASWTEQRIDQISTEHKQLQVAYRNDNAVEASIDQCNSDMSFNAVWPMTTVAGRYSALIEFIGGLASIFLNTSVVENDFSILKYEKDPYRASMTDFTLQSILH